MMNATSSSSAGRTKKITVARDINTNQPVVLVDLVPGVHLEVLATHDLPPTESYRSFYRKLVASNIWKRPTQNPETIANSESASSSSSGDNLFSGSGVADSAPSPSSASTSSSTLGRKRKSRSNKQPDPDREVKRRRPRNTAVVVPPSTRVLRADGPAV
ncbi:hypothetical protein CPC08DRAFT_713512 [Agrocybe pediades]|nr:hypothetical protein CPC08DRAFT_713512 [Agrocybe pediades]